MTAIDLAQRKVVAEVPVGVEPEGVGVSPDGKTLIATSETSNMAHFIDTDSYQVVDNVLVGSRPRLCRVQCRRIAALGHLGSGRHGLGDRHQDAQDHQDDRLRNSGRQPENMQPVGVRILKDGSKAFVALGPANHVAVIDAKKLEVEQYLLVGQRVWQLAFTPDEKLLFTTNGNSNDVSVIDVPTLKVIKSMPVGSAPWGVAISPQ